MCQPAVRRPRIPENTGHRVFKVYIIIKIVGCSADMSDEKRTPAGSRRPAGVLFFENRKSLPCG